MPYLKLLFAPFLVAIITGVFQAEGIPAGGSRKEIIYDIFKGMGFPTPKYSEVLEQKRVFSEMTLESLRNTLCFNDNVRIMDTFAGILVGLSRQPPNGALDYLLTSYFFDALKPIAPEFVNAVKTVALLIEEDRCLRSVNVPVDYEDMFLHTTAFLYNSRDCRQISKRFFVIKNLICEAMEGDVIAAKNIVNYLSAQHKDYKNLASVDRSNILEDVLKSIDWYLRVGILRTFEDAKASERK